MRNRRLLVLLSACAVSLACGGSGASSAPSAPGSAGTPTPTSYATLADACTAYCARFGPPCNDPAYSDPIYQRANPGLTPVQICTKVCNGLTYRGSSADFNNTAACDAAQLALTACQARLACGVKGGYVCGTPCDKEGDAVDQVCLCNVPRCGTLVADACTLRAGHCWPVCPSGSICQTSTNCPVTASGIVCAPGKCGGVGACVPACTGTTRCVNGACVDVCSNCLSSCRGLSGCCTGTGCICESACH